MSDDLRRTPAHLSGDMDAVAHKTSPGRAVHDRVSRTLGLLYGARDSVKGGASATSDPASESTDPVRRTAPGNPIAASGAGLNASPEPAPRSTVQSRVAALSDALSGESGECLP
ncbi:hypothetical protein [Hamadaea tsunoensis]|uniref:hypothetical protein n=1 Tax=Hamadaea tsunoensis TaxID=53368 RepID=UPI0004236ED6|nr:hypothetical protein [Hamadaea tsunoensis]